MSIVLQILEANDTRCMDDPDDRAALAEALKAGIVADIEQREQKAKEQSPDGMIGTGGILGCYIDTVEGL